MKRGSSQLSGATLGPISYTGVERDRIHGHPLKHRKGTVPQRNWEVPSYTHLAQQVSALTIHACPGPGKVYFLL